MKIADLFAGLRLKPDKASFDAGDKLISGIKKGLAVLAAWQGFQWAKGLISQTVELGGSIADLSQKIGVPAETLQQLGYAAQLSGGSMESLGNSLGKLSKLAYDASKGGAEASDAFRKVGVRIKDANGNLRPAEELFADIADHISKLPDGTEKTAKSMALFGRSGKDLIPLLNEGSEGIAKLRQEFIDLGAQMTGEEASNLEAFGDELDKIGVISQGVKNTITLALLPVIRRVVTAFVEWWKANRKLVQQRLQAFMAAVVVAAKAIIKVFGVLIELAAWLAKEWRFVVSVLGALTVAIVLFKTAAIAAAVATAAAWVAAAAPFLAIAAVIAGIALIAEDIWTWAEGGESVIGDIHKALVDLFVKAIEFWVAEATKFWAWFVDKATAAANAVRELLPEWMTGEDQDAKAFRGAYNKAFAGQSARGLDAQRASVLADPEQLRQLNETRVGLGLPALGANGKPVASNVTINAPINIDGARAPEDIARQVADEINNLFRTARDAVPQP